MPQFFSRLSLLFVTVFLYTIVIAQPKTDTTKTSPLGLRSPSTGPKAYKDVITPKAITDEGLFNVHKVEEKYFFSAASTKKSECERCGTVFFSEFRSI